MPEVVVVIDVQQALLEELPAARRSELSAVVSRIVEQARSAEIPVVYVRHDGSPGELVPGTPEWEIAREVAPREGESIVDKRFADAFAQTKLGDVLDGFEADHLIVTGMQTDFCVAATVREARRRGYRLTLVEDGHATSASGNRSEEHLREEMHREARAQGVAIVPSSSVFGRPV